MKKRGFIAALLVLTMCVALLSACSSPKEEEKTDTPAATEAPEETPVPTPTPTLGPADLSDALFIGDSRTVGIRDYSGLEGADFFCSVGMNVFKVGIDSISVPGVGTVTLSQLLQSKSYGKIYIMLGINELGYDHQTVTDKYKSVLESIESAQPDAKIFIMANLHVSANRSQSDKYVNNPSMDDLNSSLAKLANGKNIFYMDANPEFDDGSGNLTADYTPDGTHLNADLYPRWIEWIRNETSRLLAQAG